MRASMASMRRELEEAKLRVQNEAEDAEAGRAAAKAAEEARAKAEASLRAQVAEASAAKREADRLGAEASEALVRASAAERDLGKVQQELVGTKAVVALAQDEARRASAEAKVAQCELWEVRQNGAGARKTAAVAEAKDNEEVAKLKQDLAQVRQEVATACAALCRAESGMRDKELAIAHLRHVLEHYRDPREPVVPERYDVGAAFSPQPAPGRSASSPNLHEASVDSLRGGVEGEETRAERRMSVQELAAARTRRKDRWAPGFRP
mmetsp:Transcript_117728/g.375255  ORF Transcript_117728/g.375255 Transcript_117728/m.375255 type:complete len:266 (+) Transcript_117728:943-1740(+)